MRELVALSCDQCKQKNYTTTKNKKTTPDKISLRKFCSVCRIHTSHRETKA